MIYCLISSSIIILVIYYVVSLLLKKSRSKALSVELSQFKSLRLASINASLKKYDHLFKNINLLQKEEILNSDGKTLLKRLNAGELKSIDILMTYYERAATIGLELQALADINIDYAVGKAKECDLIRSKLLANRKKNYFPHKKYVF